MKIFMIERGEAPSVRRIRDVGLLVGDCHDQRRDQVEGGDRDDQGQDNEHHAFLGLHRREPVAVLLRPIADQDIAGQDARQVERDLRRALHVDDLEPQTGRCIHLEHLKQHRRYG